MLKGHSRYLVSTLALLLAACEKIPEYQVPVTLEANSSYYLSEQIPELDRHGYLMFNTKAVSKTPLHKIYDEYRFHYAHFHCPVNDNYEVTGSISADGSEHNLILYENNQFKYDVLFSICPEKDASKLACIYQLEQLKTLPQQLSCRAIFGRMFGRSVVISENIQMDISKLINAKEYEPPEREERQ